MQEIKQMGDYCPECSALAAKGVWEDGTHRYRHNGKHELTIECRPLPHSPAAPPEDAKALEDAIEQLTQDANFAEAIGQASDRAFAADLRTVINAARSREQYAAKQIERQTPAIIERFVDEVEQRRDSHGATEDYEKSVHFVRIMQTVKARRSGGEGK